MSLQRFTVQDTASYLGVCMDTIYTMVKRNEIPHFRLRRRIMFSKDSIDKWISDQEEKSCQLI